MKYYHSITPKKCLNLLVLFLLLIPVFAATEQQDKEQDSDDIVRIRIVGMADLHGNFQLYDFIRRRPAVGGLLYVQQFVAQERLDTTQHVILVNNGDFLQGQMATYYYNYLDQRDFYMPAHRFNRAGVDVHVIGNHDMEMGIGLLERFMRESNAPLLGANVVFSGTTEPFFQPYVILERGGIRIAFLGITIPIQSECITVEICKGLAVVNMLDPTRYWMNRILTRESPDLVIGVFHAGIPHGVDSLQYGKSCFYENNTIHIAENIPGFDALILGHLHRTLIKRIVNVNGDSVWLVEPGMGGRDVGVLDFEVQKRPGEKAKIISSSVHIQNVTQFPLSDEMMEEVEEECELFAIIAGDPVATLLDTMCNVKAYFGPSFFVDIIHRVQLEHTGADISFASPLSTNVLIPSGPLIFSDLFRVYRFENMMTVLLMSGQEIKDYLEFSYNKWVNQMRSPRDRMLRTKPVPTGSTAFLGRNFIIPQYYFDSAAGIDYEVDLRRPFGERIRILRMSNGEPFHENRMYSVVTTSYRVAGAGGHFQAGAGITPQVLPYRIVSVENIMIRELIRKDFANQGEVSSFSFNNWRFIPESFVRQAKMREYDELKAR